VTVRPLLSGSERPAEDGVFGAVRRPGALILQSQIRQSQAVSVVQLTLTGYSVSGA